MDAPHSPPPPAAASPNNDAEHLRLLSIFHYVCAAVVAVFSSFFLLHVAMGIAILQGNETFGGAFQHGVAPFGHDQRIVGLMFLMAGSFVVLSGWAFAALLVLAGRFLALRRSRIFCIVIAALACTFTPFGTVLGVFTLVVLLRPSVQALFEAPDRMQA